MKKTRKILSVALALLMTMVLCMPALADDTAPDDGLATRGDIVKWLYLDFARRGDDSTAVFTDIPADSDVAAAAAWAAAQGIAKGYGDGRFGPDDLVTREQAATMLYRLAQTRDQGFHGMWYFLLDAPDAGEISDWADEAMHWVVANGIITKRDDGLLAPKDYVGVNELPVWMKQINETLVTSLENGGYTLTIPVELADQLNTELPADAPEGTLFSVAEQASIDAARAKGDDGDGMGWLFDIQKISEEKAHELLCADMSGMELFAKDAEGNYFLFCTPTDVRFDRETAEQMMADSAVWAELNEWAGKVKARFIDDNGLIPVSYGNSLFEICLYRIAYGGEVNYIVSTTAFGPMEPNEAVDAASYIESALNGAAVSYADEAKAPDGEYIVLNFPEAGERFDIFSADGNLIRYTNEYGEEFMRVSYDDEARSLFDTLEAWYFALAVANGADAQAEDNP